MKLQITRSNRSATAFAAGLGLWAIASLSPAAKSEEAGGTASNTLTPQEQAATGVTPEYIRLCVGIEDVEDIKADLDQALRAAVGR